jgi:5-methylcytosine-specific restriction endonuclease McrA
VGDYHAYIAGVYLPGQWKRIANLVRRRDRFTCRDCGKRGWHVHHDHYRLLFHEEDDLTCLVTLCDVCHRRRHGLNSMRVIEERLAEWLKSSAP